MSATQASIPSEPAPGQWHPIAPGYLAQSLLTRGKVFEVYDAWSEERFSRCVVKTLRADRVTRPNRARLLREGALVCSGDHPHLVRGYEVGTRPVPFIALEVLTGATLGHLVATLRRPLAEADVALLGSQLCSALRYLHGRGVLHLDVKPENVVIEGSRAKLLDLSLAQPPGFVRAGLGTPQYLAPEQAIPGVVGEPADVWGLALTLFEAATGTNPFRLTTGGGGEPGARNGGPGPVGARCPTCDEPMDYAQLRVRAPGVGSLRRLSRRLAAAIDHALDPDPVNRPTMAELDDVLSAGATADRPPGG